MTVQVLGDVEFGYELPEYHPDTSLEASRAFAEAAGYAGGGRFEDHELARAQGLPGALLPGIMGMGFFASMINKWAPRGRITHIDTVFRAPVLADHPHIAAAVVTDIAEAEATVVLAQDETRGFGTATVVLPKD